MGTKRRQARLTACRSGRRRSLKCDKPTIVPISMNNIVSLGSIDPPLWLSARPANQRIAKSIPALTNGKERWPRSRGRDHDAAFGRGVAVLTPLPAVPKCAPNQFASDEFHVF